MSATTPQAAILLMLLFAIQHPASEAASLWSRRRDSLSDYEIAASFPVQLEFECTAAASRDSDVQLVAFNASSGLCTHFRCRLSLSHCRKCHTANKGAQEVWTASTDCWTTVQHRVSGSVDFYRNWSQYQSEFGEGPDGNYWIGLNKLHELTSSGSRKLRILMKLWDDTESWAEYSSFSVGPESDNYRLSVSGFSGSDGVGDSLTEKSNGRQFTTLDADHDTYPGNCANTYNGAFWFAKCFDAHPNGQYKTFAVAFSGPFAQGIIWRNFYGEFYSLKEIEMLIC